MNRLFPRPRIALALFVVAMVVGAAVTAPRVLTFLTGREHEVVLPGGENYRAIGVLLHDRSGLVTGFTAADPRRDDWRADVIVAEDGRSLMVVWTGGACDSSWELVFEPVQEGWVLRLDNLSLMFGCIALGVPRAVVIELSEPIKADRVVLEFIN